ncbi:MAG: hypothetical protein AB7V22_00795 [Kiritimatiellia bacterium]
MDDNVLMMRCSQCGEMNRLPVVHCKKCGARLDFETAEQRMKSAAGPTPLDQLRLAIKLGVAFVLLLLVLLMLWPAQMLRTVGDEMDAKRYRLKGELLIEALNRNLPASQVIEEKEINAHLREVLAAQPARSGFAARLEDAGARFFPGRAEAFVAIARGPLTFSATFYLRPRGAKLVVTGAKAGHLPLPGFLGKLYAFTQSGLFRQFKNESRIVRKLDGAVVSQESIELLVKGGT